MGGQAPIAKTSLGSPANETCEESSPQGCHAGRNDLTTETLNLQG